jgi:Tol biopolymer transport system component/tRNA A-37 threonylcarbamoyl transferase component Bud32
MTAALPRLTAALADRYRLERELGAGGMATVYLAQDFKHDRKVAIKVLRPELAAVIGAERFLSEIKTTANLQHPHILPLHDSGEADSFLFYVMPFVEGESLRDRLNREKQLPIGDAVRIATEVAGALDYAHRHGVIHRDIKPENILLHDGRALVADFGIALAASKAGGTRMTETGMSLGTPHYMSPEQAMGEREITARSDVYALGAVTYEMLTGDPPFTGSTAQAIVARVVTESPRSLMSQRHTIPPEVEAAVLTSLEKLPADRFSTAQAFAEALQGRGAALSPGGTTVRSATVRRPPAAGWRGRLRDPVVLGLALVSLVSVAATIVFARRPEAPTFPPVRFVMATTDSTKPSDNAPWPAAISPDGGTVVYSAAQNGTTSMLYALRTDQLEARRIPGTTNAYQPYFSPDGKWLAFEMGGKERKVRLDGSAPVTIADAGGANGADWAASDEIVFGSQGRFHGLSHVSAGGGQAIALTQPDTAKGERDHLWPIALPDGKTIVFVIWSGNLPTSRLAITSLDDGAVVPLGIPGIRPLAVVDGMLLYVQADGTVMAVRLNVRRKRIEGRPIPVHDPVPVVSAFNGNSGIFISRGGALVTSLGGALAKLVWLSRDGHVEPVLVQSRAFAYARLSPDERRIAVVVSDDQKSDVWIYDLGLSTFSRLTSVGTVSSVEWSADGSRVVFTSEGEKAGYAVWSQPAAGGTKAEKLFEHAVSTTMATMSPDGKALLVNSIDGDTWSIFRVPLDSGRVAQSYLTTSANEHAPQFSPNGKWVAVVSEESGRDEVYVRSFPDPSSRVQISVAGGGEPVWSRDGSRLYYRSGSLLLAAKLSFSPTFALLARDTVLSNTAFGSYFSGSYQPARDGKRILAIQSDRDDFRLIVSPNWITELRRRVAESSGRR